MIARVMILAAALVLAVGSIVAGPLVKPVGLRPIAAAATAETYVTGATTYVLDPAGRAVHVTIAMTFKDVKADTSDTRYYFTGYRLGIQKEAHGVLVTSGGKKLVTTVAPAGGGTSGAAYQVLDVTFPGRVYRGQTIAFEVTYDLLDSGPRSNGLVRVGPAIAAFYAWSYGADQASVKIELPAGFDPTTQGDPLTKTVADDGSTLLSATNIADRGRWFAWVTAQRPAALTSVSLEIPIDGQPEPVEVRAFPEDQAWLDAVRSRLTQGLPVLAQLIGLPWPVPGQLVVSEAYAPLLGGYAGLYRQSDQPGAGASDTINITEEPDPLVIVHEASHAWFNADLFTGRWIDEGLAEEYASRALADLGQTGYDPEQVHATDAGAFPLDLWPPPGRIDDPAAAAAERYGYNAAWTVIRSVATEIGADRMRAVFAAARARTIPYVGRPAAEPFTRAAAAPDWHVFLDLLEQVGGSRAAEGLFRTWVVAPAEQADLDAHSQAIETYADLLHRGGGWLPGPAVREPMAAWDFPAAEAAMSGANAVLARRDAVEALAGRLGLRTTSALQAAYESATSSFAPALALADEQFATLEALARARTAVAADRDALTTVGLIGEAPDAPLAAAAAAFEAGHLAEARADAATAERLIAQAPEVGRQRLLTGAALLLGLLILAALAALVLRIRRARRGRRRPAAATLGADRGTRPMARRDDSRFGRSDGGGPDQPGA